MLMRKKVPEITICRISLYRRALSLLREQGCQTVSSHKLGQIVSCSADQIRKDLSHFGGFGESGRGYDVKKLQGSLTKILGLDKEWKVALVGVGNLGSALLAYKGFRESGFHICAVFDNNKKKVGKKIGGLVIQHISRLKETVKRKNIRIGIIAVPLQPAKAVADLFISAGVRSILNFAPVKITVPDYVKLRDADLSMELECLCYFLSGGVR